MARDLLASTADDSLAVRILDILRRRRLLALGPFCAVLAATVSFAIYLPDIYQGQALVLIARPVDENIVRAADSAPGELESRLHIIKQEILSRDRALELIKRFNLYPALMKRGAFDDALNQMRSDVEVNPSGPEQVSGKVKTVSQLVAIPFLLYNGVLFGLVHTLPVGRALIWVAAAITLWSMVVYLRAAIAAPPGKEE